MKSTVIQNGQTNETIRVNVLVYRNVLDKDDLGRLNGLDERDGYVVVVEAELESEMFAFVKGALGALELNVPKGEVVGGQ